METYRRCGPCGDPHRDEQVPPRTRPYPVRTNLPGPVSAGLGRVEAVPAFADGRHAPGDPGVEGVKFFRLGRVGDERTSVAQDACPPNPLDGPGRGDVGQRVAGYEYEVRALTGRGVP